MAPERKATSDRASGEIMLNAVFKVVEQLNALAGQRMAEEGTRNGNITFSPKIVIDETGERQYICEVEIYTEQTIEAGQQLMMAWSGLDTEQFTQVLIPVFTALSGLAQQSYLSDTYTVGLVKPDGEEVEIYAPKVLEPGMYSLKES